MCEVCLHAPARRPLLPAVESECPVQCVATDLNVTFLSKQPPSASGAGRRAGLGRPRPGCSRLPVAPGDPRPGLGLCSGSPSGTDRSSGCREGQASTSHARPGQVWPQPRADRPWAWGDVRPGPDACPSELCCRPGLAPHDTGAVRPARSLYPRTLYCGLGFRCQVKGFSASS